MTATEAGRKGGLSRSYWPKWCITCDQPYLGYATQRYCSRACWPSVKVICPRCGEPMARARQRCWACWTSEEKLTSHLRRKG